MHIGGQGAIEGAMAGRARTPTTPHLNTFFIVSSLVLDSIPFMSFCRAWPKHHLIGQSSEPIVPHQSNAGACERVKLNNSLASSHMPEHVSFTINSLPVSSDKALQFADIRFGSALFFKSMTFIPHP